MLNEKYSIGEGISITNIGDEYVMFPNFSNEDSGAYICTTNKVGYFIFSSIDSVRTVQEIILAVIEKYNVDYSSAFNNVSNFLKLMEEKKIIIKKD